MDDLIAKKKLIDEKYYELIDMFKNYDKMLDDTKEIYDTNSAKYFRNVASEYMNLSLVKLDQEFKSYIDKLNDTIKLWYQKIMRSQEQLLLMSMIY